MKGDTHIRVSELSGSMVRIGLGLFFFVFGMLKLTASKWFIAGPYQGFYGVAFPIGLLYVVGVVQLGMSVSFFTNKYAKWSAWIGSGMMLSTIFATMPKILATFQLPPAAAPPGFLFFAAIPLLFMALSEALKPKNVSPKPEATHVRIDPPVISVKKPESETLSVEKDNVEEDHS